MNSEVKKIKNWINISIALTLIQFAVISYMVISGMMERHAYQYVSIMDAILFCVCAEIKRRFNKYVIAMDSDKNDK